MVEKEVVFVYCHYCGKEVQEDMQYCPNCGYPLQNSPYVYHETDAPSFLFSLISFFAPLAGLVLYIIWRKDFPQKAKSCMNGMICGIIAEILVTIFLRSYLSQNIMGVMINI
ncbi:hypothetical protein B5E79_05105 [Massilimicrobiota sp. An134]|nr:hypothetical protein B5E79_05105 [Massilimicrobiota sp. An134]